MTPFVTPAPAPAIGRLPRSVPELLALFHRLKQCDHASDPMVQVLAVARSEGMTGKRIDWVLTGTDLLEDVLAGVMPPWDWRVSADPEDRARRVEAQASFLGRDYAVVDCTECPNGFTSHQFTRRVDHGEDTYTVRFEAKWHGYAAVNGRVLETWGYEVVEVRRG
jgi:hypothetical protein